MKTPMAATGVELATREFERADETIRSQYCVDDAIRASANLMKTAEVFSDLFKILIFTRI